MKKIKELVYRFFFGIRPAGKAQDKQWL